MMFPLGSQWGFRSCIIRPPRPNDPVGIDLMPTPILAAKLRIFYTKQMTAEMALVVVKSLNFLKEKFLEIPENRKFLKIFFSVV